MHQRQLRKREEFLEHGGPQGWGANSGDLLTRSVNWKPVIAAPHGYAMGLALGIVLECDLIVAAKMRMQVATRPERRNSDPRSMFYFEEGAVRGSL